MLAPAAPSPACPACRYDLSGQVATWDAAEQCPLGGTCPECGETFEWWFVIREGGRIRGFIEDAYGLRRRITWSVRTTLWALWPWKFWSRVGDAKVKPWGWVWWLVLMVWLPRMTAFAGGVAAYVTLYRWSNGTPVYLSSVAPSMWAGCLLGLGSDITLLTQGRIAAWMSTEASFSTRVFLLEACAWPLAIGAIWLWSPAQAARPRLILRAAVFSLAPLAIQALWGVAGALIDQGIWLVGIVLDARRMLPRGVHADNWLFHTRQSIEQGLEFAGMALSWLGVAWVPLWWLAAMQRGFKLERAAQMWIVQLILINVILFFVFGPRVDPIRW